MKTGFTCFTLYAADEAFPIKILSIYKCCLVVAFVMMAEVDAQLPTDPGGEASGAENLENIRPLSVIKKQQSMFLWNSELEVSY